VDKFHSDGELTVSRLVFAYNINIVVETRRLRWMGYATHMMEVTTGY
jgi:hypothetical protein